MVQLIEKHISKVKLVVNVLVLYFAYLMGRLLMISNEALNLLNGDTYDFEKITSLGLKAEKISKSFSSGLFSNAWVLAFMFVSFILLMGYFMQQWYLKEKESSTTLVDFILAILSVVIILFPLVIGESFTALASPENIANVISDAFMMLMVFVVIIGVFNLLSIFQSLFITDFNLLEKDIFKEDGSLKFVSKWALKLQEPRKK